MFFNRRSKKKKDEPAEKKPTINQGILYLYGIIGLQVLFVFGLMAIIITMGKILATPLWVFLFALAVGTAGIVYVYRKAKAQLRKVRDALRHVDLSDRNYEISFMGGVLTMKVEHNPDKLLEDHTKPLLDADVEAEPMDTASTQSPKVVGMAGGS
ncbi:hypothetical protein SAMN02746041_01665 [Desulfacinum hydrothermale DSM 13146]|uniref:Uncharacterized protein n=1 Tax=Desulfacinum hydrothermale DSM 13146 TaxID=1121390 RepID=A0A1W1XGL6_9BACT|nr:hypothetical protein [Desulfacinum hydrothermale]SMC23135.1 hypothetical protein SAMN02746041_01665 [Desulfacinum hydrothermale DSM 13146]